MATPSPPAPGEDNAHPEFTTERLRIDADTATEVVLEALGGVSATDTDEGIKFRTTDGSLIAILTGTHYEEADVDLHYRNAPPSETATLKARKLWRVLDEFAA